MKALVKTAPGPGLTLQQMPDPNPGPSEVVVRVKATSLCGTDAHIYNWDEWARGRIHPPRIIGHEMCGEVTEMGPGVSSVAVGGYVAAESHITCGLCFQCRTGQGHVCKNYRILGIDVDGSFAEYVALPERVLWKTSRDIPPELGCIQEPLGNAVHAALVEDLSGQTVLITGCGPTGLFAAAVANFRAFFGLPPTTLHSIVAGQDPGPGDGPFRTEATLDATWAGAVAPAAQIEVVRGTDLFLILARQVNVNPAPVISISLAVCSSHAVLRRLAHAADAIFRQAAAQGQTVLVASGDTGAYNCGRREVDVLAASPHVTAVGGTEVEPLRDDAGNAVAYGTERAWNTGSTASGGGRADFFPRPAYQRGGTGRAVPDVAAPADDYPIGVGSHVV